MIHEKLTRDQAAIIGAYTGILCGPFQDLQEYAENLMGVPVYTHQFADSTFNEKLKERSKSDFLSICALR